MPLKQIKNAYNKGEFSQYMDGRTDYAGYYNGCSILINALVLPHGGFTKRPGTEYIATAANRANLIPFEFSVDDALILEFSNLLLRFYKNQAIVNTGVGTEDLSGLDNIIGHWLLNEEDGVTVVDEGVNHGTATVDCSTLHEDGKVGIGCFNLDGQYTVEIPDSDDFTFSTADANDDPFSIACWGYVTQQGGLQVLLSKWRDDNATREWRFSLTNDRKLQLHLADSGSNVESDRIAQWKLDDSAADTDIDDIVASIPHDGTASQNTNTAGFSVTGKLGNCFNFGGDQSIVIDNDHAELSFISGGVDAAASVAAWIYVTNTAGIQAIIGKWDDEKHEWKLSLESNEKIRFTLFDESANATEYRQTDDALAEGWHLVVATYDGRGTSTAANGITIYVDSVEVNSTRYHIGGTYVDMEDLTGKVTIGAVYDGTSTLFQYFADKIDNVVIYDIELTQANVNILWNSGNGTESTTAIEVSAITDNVLTTGWHFLCATYSAPADETAAADGIILYVDGVAVDSTATNDANYTAMQNGTEEIRIGSQRNSGDGSNENFWEDKIDEVSVFIDVLTPTEIASLYSTTPYSIVSPYTSAQAFQIHVTQSADVMYIAHKDKHPKKLSRLDALDWTLVDVPFKGGPFLTENTTAASLVGFARTGGTARSEYYFLADTTGTLTASGSGNEPFNSNMVGALWLIKHTRDNDNDTDTFAKDTNVVPTLTTYASGAIFIKGDATVSFEPIATTKMAQLWRKEGNGNWQTYRSFRGATAFSWTEDADDVMYAMTRSDNTINGTLTAKEAINYGVVKIMGFTSAAVVTVTVVDKVLSDNSTDGAVTTSIWAEGAWSDYRGYPRTVGFHEDRLWWASSTNNPDTLWSSKSGLYEDMSFSELGLDNEAVTALITDNEVSQIQWMMSRQVMAIGAANREYRLSAQNPEDPITPLDKKSTPQTGFSSGEIQPVMLNDSIFFLQRQGKKLGAMKFDSVTENFDVDDATLLAYGLLDSAPTNMAVSRSPDSIIWVTRTDGIMPTFTYEPKEEVAGWARQITDDGTWKVITSSNLDSFCDEAVVGILEAALDGTGIWADITDETHWFILDLGQNYKIKGFRGRSQTAGFDPTDIDIYISETNGDWGTAVALEITAWQDTTTWAEVNISTTTGRYIRVVINSTEDVDNKLQWGITGAFATIFDVRLSDADNPLGFFESAAVIHGTSEDEIWVCVRRVINAATVYYIEKFKPRDFGTDIEDAFFVDSGKTFLSVGGTTSITGAAHLKGKGVAVFADGEVQASKTVSSNGDFTIDTSANKIQYGLPYTMKVRSMRLAVPQAPSALQTKIKRATSVAVRYIRSLLGSAGVEYGGVEYLTDIEAAYSTSSADTDPQRRAIQGGFNEDAYTTILSDDPVPFTALSAVTEVEI